MSNIDKKWLWCIHACDDNLFLKEGVIALGWKSIGDLILLPSDHEEMKKVYAKIYPNDPKETIPTGFCMLYRFCNEIKKGDYIVYPSKTDQMINIGIVESAYFYDRKETRYAQKRKVKWIKSLPRTSYSQGALHEAGAELTLFMIRNYANEFIASLDKDYKGPTLIDEQDITAGSTADEIIQSTKDFVMKEL